MAQTFVRCPTCYFRLALMEDDDVEFVVEIHRLSGNCRAHVPPKPRKERKPVSTLDKFSDWGEF